MKLVRACAFLAFFPIFCFAGLSGCGNATLKRAGSAAPTITSFTANPTTITAGGTANLTGVFANGTGIITPGELAATSGTAVSVSPSNTTTYTLTVTNSSGNTVTQTVTVTVSSTGPAAPAITSFTADPAMIAAGGSAGLTGVFSGGTGVITPGNLAATSGTAVSVSPSATTTYTLTVTNTANVAVTQTATVTVTAAGAPAAPTGLTAVAGDGQVALSWTASSGATGYHVKRSTASGGPFTQVAAPTGTTYTDTGLSDGTIYYYVVTAVNSVGESGNSNEVSATPLAAGSGTGLTIPTTHPRLWWNAARLAQAKAWLTANPKATVPQDKTSADYYNDIAFRHVAGGADCSIAINYVMNNEVPAGQFSPSGNGSDQARWDGETAFVVYDWCFDQLTTQQKADFFNNIGGSGAGWNNYLTGINQQAWGGAAMTQNNYNIGNMRNDIESGIGTYWENQTAATGFLTDGVTKRWTDYFVPTVTTKAAGAVGQEGNQYAVSLTGYPIIPFVTMSLDGRDIYNESEYFKEQVYWLIYSTTPAPTPNAGSPSAYQLNPFSDDEQFVNGGMLTLSSEYTGFMNTASNYWSSLDVGKYARQWVNTVGAASSTFLTPNYVLALDAKPAALPYNTLPLDYYATGIQYLYGHKAWDTSSAYFMWQLGIPTAGVGHSHLDFGNFNLWRGGRWLSRETTGYDDIITGYGYQNVVSDSVDDILAHNCILFGTPLSPAGSDQGLALMPGRPQGQTPVLRLDSQPGYVYADVDLTPQYLWTSEYSQYNSGAAVHVERELLFLRDLETTLVFDRLTTGNVTSGSDTGVTAANEVNTFLIHFETNPTLEDATHMTATNGTQALRVTTLVPSAPVRRVINEQSCGGCSKGIGQYRVELDTSGTAQRYFLNVLQARDATADNIVATVVDSAPASPTTGTFTVTLQPATGAATVVVFNKGQTSSGGSVNLAGTALLTLRAGVQSISYTDSGPVWAP